MLDRVADELGDLVALVLASISGPTSTSSSTPRPSFSAPIRSRELLRELGGDGVVHVEAVGRGAGLTDVAHLRDHRALDRRVEVGVLEDEERRVAAELHRDLEDVLGRLGDQLAPDLGRAGEGQLAQAIGR